MCVHRDRPRRSEGEEERERGKERVKKREEGKDDRGAGGRERSAEKE